MRILQSFLFVVAACGSSSKAAPASATSPTPPAKPAAATTCPAGQLMHEGECLKECSKDEDCGKGEMCQQLHSMTEDGRIGPVSGSGCM
jgi:hypothetical protein